MAYGKCFGCQPQGGPWALTSVAAFGRICCKLKVLIPWGALMESQRSQKETARFIGTIEPLGHGWRASFRLRLSNEVFAEQGRMDVFATELEALKWLHTEAAERGFSSIEIQRRTY
jgi:hypothetical protein